MDLENLRQLFSRARELSGHTEFVIVGSNSILGILKQQDVPARMTLSIDVDAYTRSDPARIFELQRELGQGSDFELANGFYLDPVSPELPTLPQGWEGRLFRVALDDLTLHFLDPNDAAVSKYARSEPRDREWLRAGIEAGVLSPPIIDYRFRETVFFDDEERDRALRAFEEDRRLRG